MDAAKFKRLRTAAIQDELPLVAALKSLGLDAKKNSDVKKQRSWGDVLFTLEDAKRSFESQVAGKKNFSYAKHKATEYVGPGEYEHAYVMLGCVGDKEDQHFYVMCQAKHLHEFLERNKDKMLREDKYFIIPPGELSDLEGHVAAGDTIEEVTKEFIELVR